MTGFGSTTMLEAAIARKPVIFPLFAEASSEKYKDLVCFSDSLKMFTLAKSSNEYKELLIQRLEGYKVSEEVMRLRKEQFSKYVSSLDAGATQRYLELIISESKKMYEYR